MFLHVIEALDNHDEHFQRRIDAVDRRWLSSLQKFIVALRILAYRSSMYNVDIYVHIGECTILKCLDKFVMIVCIIFDTEYMRRPNNKDIACLLQNRDACDFSSMLIQLIVCIKNGKVVMLHGSVSFLEIITINLQSCLKLLHLKTCGFGMIFLALRVLTKTLIY